MIVDIRDQLGNQLFTYAAMKSVCQKTGRPFRWFSNGTILYNSVDKKFSNTIDGGAFPNIDLSERIAPVANPRYDYMEPWPRTANFLPDTFELGDEAMVRGHFQSEKYFAWNRETVLKWFSLNEHISAAAEAQLLEIKRRFPGKHTCSFHFRRGWDYENEGRMIGLDYYANAFRELLSRTGLDSGQVVAVCFSDVPVDMKFLRKLGCSVVLQRGTLFEDMALMQRCDYHIISNSTFAWWGAWLDARETIVLCPSRYPVSPVDDYPDDIFPDSWVKVPAHSDYNKRKVLLKRAWRKLKQKLGRSGR